MRANKEYLVCKEIAAYLRERYPDVLFHFDLAGLNLSRAQAGMMKSIQGQRGFPDLLIIAPRRGFYNGLFLEIKAEGTKLCKQNGEFANEHIKEQYNYLLKLRSMGFIAQFAVGFDEAKRIIDDYLNT